MPNATLYYRLRIRNQANTADSLIISSVRGDSLPWLQDAPHGDGQEFDPLTGQSRCGAFTGNIVDGITSGTDRVVTSQLEDAKFRQQLMDRRAFVEFSDDGVNWVPSHGGVLIAGFLTSLRLVSAMTWEYTVSDPTRAEHNFMAFAPQMVVDGVTHLPRLETITEFLTRWPNRGCIFGGPVRGGFRNQPDRGGWEMTIDGQNFGQALLSFVAGYAPPDFKRSTSAEDCMSAANSRTDDRFQFSWNATADQAVTFADALAGSFRDIVVEVIGSGFYQAMSGVGYFPFTEFASDNAGGLQKHLCKDIRHRGVYIGCKTSLAASGLPAASSSVRVRAFTATASDLSPIYWTGHPVDLLAKLWADAALDFDAAAIETVRHAIGDDLRLSIRVREPQNLGTFLESTIYGPLGVGVRTNTSGQLQAFAMRALPTTIPSTTILAADIQDPTQGGVSGPVFGIDESTAVKTVTFEHERLILAQDASSSDAVDGFVTQSERWEITNSDTSAPAGSVTQSYVVAGMLDTAQSRGLTLSDRVSALARQIFDRYGRGLIVGELTGIRGGATDTVQLGDEILNQLPQLPKHKTRLGDDLSVSARRMQVVRITPSPSGPQIKLADSGPNTQPYATSPTVSIAVSTNAPLSIAVVTITNAATLNAVPAGARVQMATGSSPLATAYTDVIGFSDGGIPTTAFALPAVAPGTTVWVRCRTELAGSQPSSWSTPVSVTLSAIPAVSGLSVTPGGSDGSTALVSWTAGDSTSLIEVYLRASGASVGSAIRQQVLPAGSTQFTLERLTPGNAYTVGVLARNASGDVSTTVEVTFTAGASTVTLPAPVYALGFCGSRDPATGAPQRDGVYGIAMIAADYPGFVEVSVATETAIGSGAYSGFVVLGQKTPSALGTWTAWQDIAPNDGLRRQLRARHIRDGATSSAYTPVVTVLPWTPQGLPGYPTDIICEVTMLAPSPSSDAGLNVRFQVTGIDPTGGTPLVELVALSAGMSVISGPAVGTTAANNQIWVVRLPAPGAGPGTITSRALVDVRYGDQSLMVPEQTTLAQAQGTVSIASNGTWSASADGPANTGSFKYIAQTGSFPADATVSASGTVVSGRTFSVTGGSPLTFGDTIFLTIIPYASVGTALPSIHIRGSYLTYSATKTVTYSASGWQRTYNTGFGASTPDPTFNAGGEPVNPAVPTSALEYLDMTVLAAVGTVLTQAVFSYVWNAATVRLSVFNMAVYANGSLQAFGTGSYAGGSQTKTVAISSVTVTSSLPITLRTQWNGPISGVPPADAAQASTGIVALTYNMPTPDKTV
jgi:hypothetical protein